ncbi:MAG TPA: 23S rRNA (guanosine(2251)-2'-O)-methyltransferase RlmB [Steroidobacteraceae bacterium]|nr:23S rRNA (guanosine(2251)-2'-O)-methyltransferase RlmB [Steroidobacteraceae bacterium]
MTDTTQKSLVWGIHSVRAVLSKHPKRIALLTLQTGRDDARIEQLATLAGEHGVKVERKAARELDHRCNGELHQGALAELTPATALGEGALDDILDAAGPMPLVLVLDGVQDPHNLGACLRTADACGVHAVVVPRDRAASLSPIVRKVASGAAESVPLIQVVNLARTLKWLKERGLWLVGTDDEATQTVHAGDLKGPLAIVMGGEGAGMRRLTREHCDLLVSIPMAGVVESLNVSVATGVVLYEAIRQRSVLPNAKVQ